MFDRALALVILETVATTAVSYVLAGLAISTLMVGIIGLVVVGATLINGSNRHGSH